MLKSLTNHNFVLMTLEIENNDQMRNFDTKQLYKCLNNVSGWEDMYYLPQLLRIYLYHFRQICS